MPFVPSVGHMIPAMRAAQESQNARWNARLDAAGITEEVEATIVPKNLPSGLFGSLNAMNQHKEILVIALAEADATGTKISAERLGEIAAAYRDSRSLRGRLRRLFRR